MPNLHDDAPHGGAELPWVLLHAQLRLIARTLGGTALCTGVGYLLLHLDGASAVRFVLGAVVCAGLLFLPGVAAMAIADVLQYLRAHAKGARRAGTPETL